MVRKSLCLVLASLMLLFAVSAQADTIRPLESVIDLDELSFVKTAGVPGVWEDGMLTLTLYEPETFDAKAIAGLKVGDVLMIGGKEVPVTSLDLGAESGAINQESGENVYYLYMNEDRDFTIMDSYDMTSYRLVGDATVPVAEGFLFLDGVDPATGEPLSTRTEHSFEEFLAIRDGETASEGIGFNQTNTTVAFNSEGQLESIERIYTPWQ